MTVTWSPAGDMAVMDGLETVTVVTGADSEVSASAVRRAVTTKEAEASNGDYTTADYVYHLPVADLTFSPLPGGSVTDADTVVGVILDAQKATIKTRWRLICRDLQISEDLTTLVDIELATFVKGAGGAQEETWAVWQSEVRAKLQRVSAMAGVDQNKRDTATTWVMYSETQHLVNRNHRVVNSEGDIFRVLGFHMPDRIDALFEIDLTEW